MSVQYQFQLEDARRKQEEAFTKKKSTNNQIYLGVVSLILAIFCFSITQLEFFRRPTDTTNPFILVFVCCLGFSILFGITAIILIPLGFIRRNKLNAEIDAANSEIREIRMHLIAQEEKNSEIE